MKQPLLIQEDKRSWRLSALVGALFGLVLFGCFVAQNYETQREIAIGWATPSLRVDQAGRSPAQSWPILRVEKANLNPYNLWDLMGQGMTFNAQDEEEYSAAEKTWLQLLQNKKPRVEFQKYEFAMMICAVEEIRKDPTIKEQWIDLVYGNNGEDPWRDRGLREVYEEIMMEIIKYLELAENWVNANPDPRKKFEGTAAIPDPFRGAIPVVNRPAACTDELEQLAKQCIANKGKGVTVSPRYESTLCRNAMNKCDKRALSSDF